MTFWQPSIGELRRIPRRAVIAVGVVVAIVVLLVLFNVYVGQYTDLLWYRSVQHSSVWSRRLTTELLLFFVCGTVMAAVVAGNLLLVWRYRPMVHPATNEQRAIQPWRRLVERARWVLFALVTAIVLVAAGAAGGKKWQTWLLWRDGTPFHLKDPQFHRDVSYFVFTYPFQRAVLGFVVTTVVVSLLLVLATNYVAGGIRLQPPGPRFTHGARTHVSVLLGVFVLLKAVAYWLDRYALAFSTRGNVTGPSYTDVHAVLPAKTILVFVAVICSGLFFASVRTRSWRLPAVGFGLMVLSALVIGGAYPAIVQQFKVKPSAQDLEAPYIQRNIDETRVAYGLTSSQVSVDPSYPGSSTAPAATQRADATKNVQLRVLDPNVVSQTFEQLQQQRSFYGFTNPLDVDRYTVNGALTDVDIGVRELQLSGLAGNQQSWINEHLVYTHGYGVVAAQSDTEDAVGNPSFVESNLPPTGSLGDFQPQIYFGEGEPSYSIVGAPKGAAPREFDFPTATGDQQQNNTYTGSGGVSMGSTWDRLVYAWKLKDKNVLLSSGVNSDSKILYIRDPAARVQKVAPWLTLDSDPYPVVVDGHVDWVVDGYTTASGFPYSEQQSLSDATADTLSSGTGATAQGNGSVNYIRNSVKAVVDAYDGSVTLYEWDDPYGSRDPVLATWMKAFPGLVQPERAIPADLLAHLRYPEDLFNVQRTLLTKYHESNPRAFYSGGTFWTVPDDPTQSGSAAQPPYYLTLSPDGGSTPPVFSLTSVLTSLNRRNVTAFVSVDSQPGPSYGKLTVLELPSSQAVAGPGQVQNNIESDPAVSQELTLLRGGGSQVVLGNLLSVPLDGSLLYVEPIYVQAAASAGQSFPILRRIVAVSGTTIAFENSLTAALDAVFSTTGTSTPPTSGSGSGSPPPSGSTSPSAALAAAVAAVAADNAAAQADLRAGNFAAYGKDERKLAADIARLQSLAGSSSTASPTPSAAPSPTASP